MFYGKIQVQNSDFFEEKLISVNIPAPLNGRQCIICPVGTKTFSLSKLTRNIFTITKLNIVQPLSLQDEKTYF